MRGPGRADEHPIPRATVRLRHNRIELALHRIREARAGGASADPAAPARPRRAHPAVVPAQPPLAGAGRGASTSRATAVDGAARRRLHRRDADGRRRRGARRTSAGHRARPGSRRLRRAAARRRPAVAGARRDPHRRSRARRRRHRARRRRRHHRGPGARHHARPLRPGRAVPSTSVRPTTPPATCTRPCSSRTCGADQHLRRGAPAVARSGRGRARGVDGPAAEALARYATP